MHQQIIKMPRHARRAESERILTGPPAPDTLTYLWEMFLDLRSSLGVGMEGLHSLTGMALESWMRITGNELTLEEIAAMRALDAVMRHPRPIEELTWT